MMMLMMMMKRAYRPSVRYKNKVSGGGGSSIAWPTKEKVLCKGQIYKTANVENKCQISVFPVCFSRKDG